MGEFAWPFGLGLLAAFNPCGFAMLPAYLSYFLGIESKHHDQSRLTTVVRGLAVGGVMSLGFVAVFGSFGLLTATVLSQGTVLDYVPYVIIAVGVLMVPMGVAMLMGRDIVLPLPKMNKGTGSRDLGSVFMFGVSYAVVSLGCTVGIFIINISDSFTRDGIARGTGNFLAYAAGMGLVITFLTMSLALAKSNVAVSMRRLLPYIGRVSGALLVLAGIYMIDFGIWDYRVLIDGNVTAGNLLVDQVEELQTATTVWIETTTTERIGVLSLMGILGALMVAWRDDVADAAKRLGILIIFWGTVLLIEVANGFDFVFLPLVRFVAGWPARIGHWFTDPARGGVPLEILFVALVAWIVWRRVDRYRPQHAPGVVGAT
ncbi:MAG: cytochrome c biogenesis CcdA family protein [Acidimicrobiales bacterium]|nr:cytochrome c biogenesis CcdA family protein [Acidimicrobiales bacterium]